LRKQALSLFMVVGVGLACSRDQIQSTQVEKAVPAPLPSRQPTAPVSPAGGELPPAPVPGPGGTLQWTLPKGWTAAGASGMRYATLKPGAGTEVSIVVLTGAAGGELANLNRWRGQLGLPPVDEAALGQARKVVKSKAGAVSVFDLTGGSSRMVVGLLSAPTGDTWFLKLTGEDAPVAQAKPDFMKLLGTLTLG
jgi:hypothetical protein